MTGTYKSADEWRREPQPAPSPPSPIPAPLLLLLAMRLQIFPCHSVKDGQCSCGNADCASSGKHPWLKNWQALAATDLEQIARWLIRYPGCNWGVCTGIKSGVLVVDIDPRHGGDAAWAALEQQHGVVTTWISRTGGGGSHFWFRHPGLGEIRNSAGLIGQGIDGRGDGGFVIVPPSIGATGRPYAWDVDHHPDDEVLADLPGWILERIDRAHIAAPTVPAEEWHARFAEIVPEGERTSRLIKLAGHLLRRRVDPYVALELLQGWNATKCRPPLEDTELQATVANIARRELKRREESRHAA